MKKIIFSFLILFVAIQEAASQTPAEQLANKIAKKMKDSLSLSELQQNQVYEINLQLSEQKSTVRKEYRTSPVLATKIQQVENMRDSLYKEVLTEQQYVLYRQKKRKLVNNN